jgi:hypothetical protein
MNSMSASTHAETAVKGSSTREEITETMGMPLNMGAGSSLMYAAQAVEAYDRFAQAGVSARSPTRPVGGDYRR